MENNPKPSTQTQDGTTSEPRYYPDTEADREVRRQAQKPPSGRYYPDRDQDKEPKQRPERQTLVASRQAPSLPTFHRGGTVRATGPARLLKGERVLSRKQVREQGRSKKGRR